MTPLSTPHNQATQPAETLAEQFQRLARLWCLETAYVSSTSEMTAHPAFQEIVGLGAPVIPLLLRELENGTPGHWHRALRRITGVDPVPTAARGNVEEASNSWLRWGKEQGYRW